jgi:hypothetical protein
MTGRKMPLGTWMVVDIAFNGWNVVSSHASQHDAEVERDKRNAGLARRRYSACKVLEPVAERSACS